MVRRLPTRMPGGGELVDWCRDEVVNTPQFYFSWWLVFFLVVAIEGCRGQPAEYSLMIVLGYVIFSLPCLRICCIWSKLYQTRRARVTPEPFDPTTKEPPRRKKKAATEEEMLQMTRARQTGRVLEGSSKAYNPQATKPKHGKAITEAGLSNVARTHVQKHKTRGYEGGSKNKPQESNTGGIVGELKMKNPGRALAPMSPTPTLLAFGDKP